MPPRDMRGWVAICESRRGGLGAGSVVMGCGDQDAEATVCVGRDGERDGSGGGDRWGYIAAFCRDGGKGTKALAGRAGVYVIKPGFGQDTNGTVDAGLGSAWFP